MRVRVTVLPRAEVLDPQGRAVHHALVGLAFIGVRDVRVGRVIDLELDDSLDRTEAEATVRAMARQLLANLVVEDFAVEFLPG
jgi:phosphoribosylformylglycinamidine synthase PurS subunit